MLGAQKIKLTTLAFPVTHIYKALVMTEEHTAKKNNVLMDQHSGRRKKQTIFGTSASRLAAYIYRKL